MRQFSSPTKSFLLTRRPTKIAEIVDVDLPWPRSVNDRIALYEPETALPGRFWQEVER